MRVIVQPLTAKADPENDSPGQVAVVIDALRASVTIVTALALGAREVVPVSSLEEALELKKNDRVLIAGERGGRWVEGFDLGNSPGQFLEQAGRIKGATLVLTTSNGTGTILRAARSKAVLIGCLPNLGACMERAFSLARERGADIALYPAGWLGSPAEEDLFTARAMGRALARMGASFEPGPELAGLAESKLAEADPVEFFQASEAGRLLDSLGYGEDVVRCAAVDSHSLTPRYREGRIKVG